MVCPNKMKNKVYTACVQIERTERAEYKTYVIPVIIGVLCGGITEGIHEVQKIFD